MNMPCGNTAAISDYEHNQARLESQDELIAIAQLERVQQAAVGFLNNMSTIVTRKRRAFDHVKGALVTKEVQVVYGMGQVAERFCESVTEGLVLGLLRGEPQALYSAQYLIGEAAHEVAFEALDFQENPFINLDELRIAAGES